MKNQSTKVRGILALGATLLVLPLTSAFNAAQADPPRWAPANGYRRKQDDRRRNSDWRRYNNWQRPRYNRWDNNRNRYNRWDNRRDRNDHRDNWRRDNYRPNWNRR